MISAELLDKARKYLRILCDEIPERCVGSEGNRRATSFFKSELARLEWQTESAEFSAIDWVDGGAELTIGDKGFEVLVSPYSLGCSAKAVLAGAKNISELENQDLSGKIVLLHGEIAKEQLMPKNFVFYNPEEHRQLVSLLENSGAAALVCATGRNASLAGGVYPFPLIEDGDFDVPSVYMTEEEGKKLLPHIGEKAVLKSFSERIPGVGYNVLGVKREGDERIVVTAHIDSKKGSPGAIDNASGVVILLLLAELLRDYSGTKSIEIVAFNGEDYYAVPGQMQYIKENQGKFDTIALNINIDGAGYREGPSAFSFFDPPKEIRTKAERVMAEHPGIVEGVPWPQGDHSIFLQFGRPAIAVSSKWFIDNIDSQEITHTQKDNISIVDCEKLVDIASAISSLIRII